MNHDLTAKQKTQRVRTYFLFASMLLITIAIVAVALINTQRVHAAACTTPTTSFGTVTMSVNVPVDGIYRVWSQVMASDATNNSYLLEIDGSSCYVVGDDSFAANSWKWVDYQNGITTTKITASLTAGTHTLKAIGREDKVKLDKLILTSDLSCVPSGDGSNCTATPPPPPPPMPTYPYDNKIIVRPSGAAYYVEGGRSHPISTPAIRDCIAVRRGAGQWIRVTDPVVDQYTLSPNTYCNYEQELGLNFVREDGDPTVWLVHTGGTKQHVGTLCSADAYIGGLKKYHVFVVPPTETAGHIVTSDFFGTSTLCSQLPG